MKTKKIIGLSIEFVCLLIVGTITGHAEWGFYSLEMLCVSIAMIIFGFINYAEGLDEEFHNVSN